MDKEKLEDVLKILDAEASSGEKRAFLDADGILTATPPALHAMAADMLRASDGRPVRYVSEDDFWAAQMTAISDVKPENNAVEIEREAFRKRRLGELLYVLGVAALIGFGLFFLYLFFAWWFNL